MSYSIHLILCCIFPSDAIFNTQKEIHNILLEYFLHKEI